MSLGHVQPLQNWSHMSPLVVLMPVVIVVVAVVVAVTVLDPELELDSSAPLDPELLDPVLDSPPPLLEAALAVLSPVALVLVIVVPTVTDVPKVGSPRVSLLHATIDTQTRRHRAIVSTVAHLLPLRAAAIAIST